MAATEKDAKAKDEKAAAVRDEAAAEKVFQQETQPIPVRALETGFYGGGRVRKGTLFFIKNERELGKWMERRDTTDAKKLDEAEAARTADAAKFAK